jgi:site-specific recombinase XerC
MPCAGSSGGAEVNGHSPALDRELMKGFVADLLDGGAEASTARSRQLGVRRFSAWLTEEGEIDTDPLLGLKAPKLDAKVTDSLTDDELKRLDCATSGGRDGRANKSAGESPVPGDTRRRPAHRR